MNTPKAKVAIIYESKTGNTKQIAKAFRKHVEISLKLAVLHKKYQRMS